MIFIPSSTMFSIAFLLGYVEHRAVWLTLSQTSPGFNMSAVQDLKTLWEKEKLLVRSNFSFSPTVFSTFVENFLPFSSNLKLSSAKSFSLEESEVCRLEKG